MKNQVQLICYIDRLGGKGIAELADILNGPLKGLFGGLHLLPFFYPIDGSDAGFDPIDHCSVDPRLGSWDHINALSQQYEIMADMIVNHISAASVQFKDVLEKGDQSMYSGLFLSLSNVFPNGVSEEELLKIYRPRPGLPFRKISLKDGSQKLFWTTFTPDQIDIDVYHTQGRQYLSAILDTFQQAGIKMIRMDAVGYAVKKAGTSCFMIPETFELIQQISEEAGIKGMEVLVEIHSHYQTQIDIAQKVNYVYDFALPPLILHALFTKQGKYLAKWLEISPHNAITVLDTHDGIGIIDIGPNGSLPGLVPNEDIDLIVETIHSNSQGQSRLATGAAASNLDLYQVNCTYYDALGRNDQQYLMARMIQFFAPGIPQIYYMGMLAETNDMDLLKKTNVGRDINRHYFSRKEVDAAMKRPVVQSLCGLIRFRNAHPAFMGQISCKPIDNHCLDLSWTHMDHQASLSVDFSKQSFSITFTRNGKAEKIDNSYQLAEFATYPNLVFA